jgi:hypothetical protein
MCRGPSPVVRVDVAVDRDRHEGAVEHVGVASDPAVRRVHDHGFLREVQTVPVVDQLFHAHVRLRCVGELASGNQGRHVSRIFVRGRF